MVTYIEGNLFKTNAQVITNTINCVGVMGKGIALEFKQRYPEMFDDYLKRHKEGNLMTGRPYLWSDDNVEILNFPTKRHWKNNSFIEDIEQGLKYLSDNYAKMGIRSIAMPALGCGNGGLFWPDVKVLIDQFLGEVLDLEVYVYLSREQMMLSTEDNLKRQGASEQDTKIVAKQPSL